MRTTSSTSALARTGLTLWLCMLCLALASSALADAPRTISSDKLLRRGAELRGRGRDKRALVLFQRAYDQDARPQALAEMGQAEFALGMFAQAQEHLTAALRHDDDPWIVSHRVELTDTLERILPGSGGSAGQTVAMLRPPEQETSAAPPPSMHDAALRRAEHAVTLAQASVAAVDDELDRLEAAWLPRERPRPTRDVAEIRGTLSALEVRLSECGEALASIDFVALSVVQPPPEDVVAVEEAPGRQSHHKRQRHSRTRHK